uniref:Uncharacterized protein n=1 Tax=Leersia perrieri TaxID=77586 RepID=A0A0D9WNX3_9ORYZ
MLAVITVVSASTSPSLYSFRRAPSPPPHCRRTQRRSKPRCCRARRRLLPPLPRIPPKRPRYRCIPSRRLQIADARSPVLDGSKIRRVSSTTTRVAADPPRTTPHPHWSTHVLSSRFLRSYVFKIQQEDHLIFGYPVWKY